MNKYIQLFMAVLFFAFCTNGNTQRMPPRAAIDACTGKTMGASCKFIDRQNIARGICNDRPGIMACAPNRDGNNSPQKPQANTQSQTNRSQYSLKGNGSTQFKLEAWADNWFAAYLGNQLIVEDSVPISTERSFNAETVIFDADYPLQLNFIIKDFMQNNTGLEYIGRRKQQMGDGGFIMQLTDLSSGKIISVSDGNLKCKVIQKAPLNKSCERSSSPTAGKSPCDFVLLEEPPGWKKPDFNDSSWENATIHSYQSVRPKDGYDKINWAVNTKLIWGPDLKADNTLLCRTTIK